MERKNVTFNARISPVKTVNDEFTLCRCYICALGKNRNFSHIGKEAADKAEPTIYNIPVIGNLVKDENGEFHMGGHDAIIEQTDDGSYRFKSVCVPFGVLPSQENLHYETVTEPNGDNKEYLVGDVILWTGRYPELYEAVYSDSCYFGQSMEINVSDYAPLEEDKNYQDILSYTYSALCLLGKSDDPEHHVEPCFPMSSVVPYTYALNDEFAETMETMKASLKECFEELTAAEPVKTVDTIADDGEPAAMTAEPEQQPEEPEEPEEEFTELEKEIHAGKFTFIDTLCAIATLLDCKVVRNSEGRIVEEHYFTVYDADETYAFILEEVYSEKGRDVVKYYRVKYTFDAESKTAAFISDFEEMFMQLITAAERDEIERKRSEYDELVKYKQDREEEDRKAQYDAAVNEFSALMNKADFEAVSEKRYSFSSTDELREACYALIGKREAATRKAKVLSVGVPSTNKDKETTLRDRFHEEFGNK